MEAGERVGLQPEQCPTREKILAEGGVSKDGVVLDIRRWAKTCFAEGEQSSEKQIHSLILQAAEAARDDHGITSANTWAGGYEFPEEYFKSDVKFLRSQILDFRAMVRRRLLQLSHDRLSNERVEKLRLDNPERALMFELVGGMKVHRPEGFTPNGTLPRTPLRSTYESVAPAVNKMLGSLIEQKLAFLIRLDIAQS